MLDSIQMDDPLHVMTEDDPQHESSTECWCGPTVVNMKDAVTGEHKAFVVVHNYASNSASNG